MLEAFPLPLTASTIRAIRFRDTWHADRDGGARRHEGTDIAAPEGTPILAASSGRVMGGASLTMETPRTGFGVMVRGDDGRRVLYAHLQAPSGLRPGQRVHAGEPLGNARVGRTGNARRTGPHLHFGVYGPDDAAVNPFPELADLHAAIVRGGEAVATHVRRHPEESGAGVGWILAIAGLWWLTSRKA